MRGMDWILGAIAAVVVAVLAVLGRRKPTPPVVSPPAPPQIPQTPQEKPDPVPGVVDAAQPVVKPVTEQGHTVVVVKPPAPKPPAPKPASPPSRPAPTVPGPGRGIDRLKPYTDTELAQAKAQRFTFVGMYVGGPYRNPNPWHPLDVTRIRQHGLGILPYYVGRQNGSGHMNAAYGAIDARDAVGCMIRFGFHEQDGVALDFEAGSVGYGDWEGYIQAWCAEVARTGFKPWLYSSPRGITLAHGFKVRPQAVIIAEYPGISEPHNLTHIPGVPDQAFFGHRAWQWTDKSAFGDLTVSEFPVNR